jgi:hypothetical protein
MQTAAYSMKPDVKRTDFERTSTYQIGKTIAVVDCIFRQDGAETVKKIIEKLIKSDVEINS